MTSTASPPHGKAQTDSPWRGACHQRRCRATAPKVGLALLRADPRRARRPGRRADSRFGLVRLAGSPPHVVVLAVERARRLGVSRRRRRSSRPHSDGPSCSTWAVFRLEGTAEGMGTLMNRQRGRKLAPSSLARNPTCPLPVHQDSRNVRGHLPFRAASAHRSPLLLSPSSRTLRPTAARSSSPCRWPRPPRCGGGPDHQARHRRAAAAGALRLPPFHRSCRRGSRRDRQGLW